MKRNWKRRSGYLTTTTAIDDDITDFDLAPYLGWMEEEQQQGRIS